MYQLHSVPMPECTDTKSVPIQKVCQYQSVPIPKVYQYDSVPIPKSVSIQKVCQYQKFTNTKCSVAIPECTTARYVYAVYQRDAQLHGYLGARNK